ncbi:precorrin-2 dehydrogenase [Raoultella terrigena]|uniref:precorrin-2 dehydrogenase n=1 Tax=Raoultella terrigena TaxID=577 RepID=A0A3P8KG74_RAOTE|nr:precorrin-2 dehydrogenase [Raoultella terrigena]
MLVIGGGEIAARKIMFLRRAGAKVQVVAAELSDELAEQVERQEIAWRAQEFQEQQIDDVFLVIAATGGRRAEPAGFCRGKRSLSPG